MWTIAKYQPTTFFSLRSYTATSSGGKSLIVPTPFAIKMALLDAAIRTQGIVRGRALFPHLRDMRIAVRLPRYILVNKTLARILRLKEIKTTADKKEAAMAEAIADLQWPFQRTICFREYVQFGGPLILAFQGMSLQELEPLLTQVNYLGKRGGFFQLIAIPKEVEEIEGFTILTEGVNRAFPMGTLQMVDDCGPQLTFEQVDVYSSKCIKPGQDRVFHHIVLPHRPVRSSRGFTLYEYE